MLPPVADRCTPDLAPFVACGAEDIGGTTGRSHQPLAGSGLVGVRRAGGFPKAR
jgi:hypothetical protein